MRMEGTAGERRRSPRWRAQGLLPGQFGDALKVFVADISADGILIEHPNALQPGTIRFLTLALAGGKVNLKCRVVRTGFYTQEAWPTAEDNAIFRTGLEVLELTEASQALIAAYIESLKPESRTLP